MFEAPNGRTFRPSTFVTLTLPSYGPVRSDGAPRDPERYDYRLAARDALHFGKLVDRFWQNLRRAAGWNVQYFAAVEPQRRGAPHLHAAIRGTLPRRLIREVAAATYHQVWWPPADEPIYTVENPPIWDETRDRPCYVDPANGAPLPSWEQALDTHTSGDDAVPAHVLGFGPQVDIQGVLGETGEADRALAYLTKYLTKGVAECHTPETPAAHLHVDRLVEALRHEPCSESCANWLLYGLTPKNARAGLAPGMCLESDHNHWKALLREAGVREARLHDARHTAATMLLLLGVPERAAMAAMGWSHSAMAKRYQHVTEPIRRDIASRVGELLWNSDDQPLAT